MQKLRVQNDNLKKELKTLAGKLEEYLQASRQKRLQHSRDRPDMPRSYAAPFEHKAGEPYEYSTDPRIESKQKELHQTQRQIKFYKREIDRMRAQLDGSYNIQKIMTLENEQSDKLRQLRQLEHDYGETMYFQKD